MPGVVAGAENITRVVQTTTTDSSGHWAVSIVPNTALTPAGSFYIVSPAYSSAYAISVGPGGGRASTLVVTTGLGSITIPGFGNPMLAQDDLIVGGVGPPAGAATRLPKGADGTVLTVDPATHHLVWAADTDFQNPMTTQDDLIVAAAAGAPARLGKGADSQVLTVDPATHHLLWATPFSNPMTTQDDIIVAGAAGAATRLAKGADATVLTIDPATHHVAWDAIPAITPTLVRARVRAVGGATSIAGDGLFHTLTLATVDYDPSSTLSVAGVFTAPIAGPYLVIGEVAGAVTTFWCSGLSVNNFGVGAASLHGSANGAQGTWGAAPASQLSISRVEDVFVLAQNDTVQLLARQESGGALSPICTFTVIFQH